MTFTQETKTDKKMKAYILSVLMLCISIASNRSHAQQMTTVSVNLSEKEKSIILISSLTAKGDLTKLKTELIAGLETGLTVNEIREAIVHLYAYCGFPRSIRGLQTFMEVLDQRKAKGIRDETGRDASPIKEESSKYERGKKVLGELTNTQQPDSLTGFSAFAPVIDTFLKEHLFSDIFERDLLTYTQRELVTISVLSSLGDVEPMLRSHLSICLNVGLTPDQLKQFVEIIKLTIGKKKAKAARNVLNEVLKSRSNI
jgi:alkylhydroperoxidase/carboxymuconolactone decarboxylase family protein YurZ